MYSQFFLNFLSSPPPDAPAIFFIFTLIILRKLSSPNVESHNKRSCANSISLICINITPSSVSSFRAISNRLVIKLTHLECLNPSSLST